MDTVLYPVWAAITKQLDHNSNKMWAAMCIHGERLGASTTNAVAWIQAAHIDQIDNWEAVSWPIRLGFFLWRRGRRPSIKMKGRRTTSALPYQWHCNRLVWVAATGRGGGCGGHWEVGHVQNKQGHTEVTVKQFFSPWCPPVCMRAWEHGTTFVRLLLTSLSSSYGFMRFICSANQ